ncbi:MAG: arylesterase [Pseudomonadota bacterium]
MNAICSRTDQSRAPRVLSWYLMTLMLWSSALMAADQKLLIIGDSLSDAYDMPREAGWAYLLDERLDGNWEVINAAISGETTAGAAFRTTGLLQDHQPSHVLIILGGNDGLRALGPAQVRRNLDTIIQEAEAAGADVALMQVRLPASLGPVYLRRFEAIYPELAERYGLTLLPFFLEAIFDQPGMIMADGIHPTEAAQPLMLDAVWTDMEKFLSP